MCLNHVKAIFDNKVTPFMASLSKSSFHQPSTVSSGTRSGDQLDREGEDTRFVDEVSFFIIFD